MVHRYDEARGVLSAAIREVQEETGVDAAIDRLIGAYSRPDDPLVFIAFAGHAIGGDLRPGDEAVDVRFFPFAALPPPAFPHDPEILADWCAGREAP